MLSEFGRIEFKLFKKREGVKLVGVEQAQRRGESQTWCVFDVVRDRRSVM